MSGPTSAGGAGLLVLDPLAEPKLKAQTELQKEDMRQHGAMAREVVKQQAQEPVVVPINAGMGM